ncbi:MAG: hypothetical protein V4675_05485 [Verrucomicrobiota bacterium]
MNPVTYHWNRLEGNPEASGEPASVARRAIFFPLALDAGRRIPFPGHHPFLETAHEHQTN